MKILFIDSCIRKEESRTLDIAKYILSKVEKEYEIEHVDLNTLKLTPYDSEVFASLNTNGPEKRFLEYAQKISEADVIFIASPFYDMGIPALLKTFLERCSIPDILFHDDGKTCFGISKCQKMFLVTTRGMNIKDDSSLEQATPYLKALCFLWGIKKFDYISAYNLDYLSEDELKNLILKTKEEGLKKFKEFMKVC